jgi:Zn-dependent peptidase ImmA (M78 family)
MYCHLTIFNNKIRDYFLNTRGFKWLEYFGKNNRGKIAATYLVPKSKKISIIFLISSEENINRLISVITHEIIHSVLHKIDEDFASECLNNIHYWINNGERVDFV